MVIKSEAISGTHESNDVFIKIGPGIGLQIEIESIVKNQFEDAIFSAVSEVLKENGVDNCSVSVFDHGALDCVIRARTETALIRAGGSIK
ncbi:MAG: citrate lyase acyl carrier protein [Clostridia bacterium]